MPNPAAKISPALLPPGLAAFAGSHPGQSGPPVAPTAPASAQGAFAYYNQAIGQYLPVQITHAKAATRRLLGTVK